MAGLAWAPDGKRLAVSLGDEEQRPIKLYLVDPEGRSPPERLTSSERGELVQDWSALDVIAFLVVPMDLVTQIWTLDLGQDGEARPFVSGPGGAFLGAFSPDGRWLAYVSRESGREEVYVRPYPEAEPVHRVSRDGGSRPLWSRDGRTLFYRSGVDNRSKMMAIDVSMAEGTFRVGRVREVIDRLYLGGGARRSYDVAADGRFLMLVAFEHPLQPVTRLHVVLHWSEELKPLAPTQSN